MIRVDPGETATEMLAHYLCLLARHPEIHGALGTNARKHVAEHHSLEKVAAQYVDVLRQAGGDSEAATNFSAGAEN